MTVGTPRPENPGMGEASPGCPRCGAAAAAGPECPRCGVVLAKARGRSSPTVSAPGPAPDPRRADSGWWHFPAALVALITGGLYLWESGRAPAPAAALPPPRPPLAAATRPLPESPSSPAVTALAGGAEPAEAEIGDPAADTRFLPRTHVLVPQSDPDAAPMWQLMKDQDWYGAEAAARALLEKHPQHAQAWCALGSSLLHQDKLHDALDAAHRCRDASLEREVEGKLRVAARSDERQVAHFHIRYDGEVHEEIARDVLRLLDADYATLVTTLGYEPKRPIPVELLSREAYVEETGKTWSVGQYSHREGRIRLKVRDLSVTPRFEETVLHELVHAFLGDLSHDRTPRDINEGLAQYVSGERIGWEVTSERDAARYPWKRFYDDALSFTEYLIAQRGVSGVVEALGKLGESGDVNGSFRQVFEEGLPELRRKWEIRRRQVAGSS